MMGEVYSNYINGEWRESKSGNLIDSINPANLEVVGSVQFSTIEEVTEAIDAAKLAKKNGAN